MRYNAKQKDIIWIDFNPSKGYEIKKRRPALVLSSDAYNKATKYAIVTPITSTDTVAGNLFEINGYQTKGKVNTAQMYSLDVTENANRKPEFIEKIGDDDFKKIAALVKFNFEFFD